MNTCCPEPQNGGNANVPPVSWCAGNYTLTYDKGRVIKVPRAEKIEDGIYTNPTITMQDGCVVAIEQGTNVVYSACDPCVTPVTPPDGGSVTLSGDACNLTVETSGDGLLTQLFVGMNTCIRLTGCGVAANPLTAEPIISPDAGNALECRGNGLFVANPSATTGANFVGCGIVIQNGLITTLPLPFQPVLTLVSSDGSMIITRDAANPCLVDLQAVPQDLVTVSASARGYQYNTVGDLPPTPIGNGIAVVGAANPRDAYVYIDTFGWAQLVGVTVNL